MSARYFYRDDSLPSSDSDSDYQEVQYSSSSIDRSSIGSIPWADDAIKQNQLDWEKVERMFRGEQDLSEAEPELRNEILEWHKKFPNILRSQNPPLGIDKLSSLSFTSDDYRDYDDGDDEDDEPEDGTVTPTNEGPSSLLYQPKHSAKSLEPLPTKQIIAHEKLISMLANDLKISSIPMAVRRLGNVAPLDLKLSGHRAPITRKDNNAHSVPKFTRQFDSSSGSNPEQSLSRNGSSSATMARMPPILKVIEAKHNFQEAYTKHKSFVQLTAPNQAQSAAVTTRRRRWFPQGAGLNSQINKNNIILPAINLHRVHEIAPPLGGRSISAAFNNRQMSWSYLPYSAAKFKIHK
ncbi:uncharacterized protein LOC129914600 [Episyrphus balteatus]|uniref:uncharacterized protein LOC129914600 n=1 Tax=Episyrphus balteatus TaxID=286459 RepID=UPI002486B585|nr:uncharacterized protein LOC129914600 [Episyrphus balteatus]